VPSQNGARSEFVLAVRDLISEMDARGRALAAGRNHADEIGAARTKLVEARDALRPLDDLVDTSPIDPLIEWLSILIGKNPAPAEVSGRGRKKGSLGDCPFRLLVCKLRCIESAYGVRFTLSDSAGEAAGTLPKVIELLRPHVGCVPNALTYDVMESHDRSHMDVQMSATALPMLRRLFPPPIILVRH
jgi:hypothetical protein